MKRSELKQIIREVIEESKTNEPKLTQKQIKFILDFDKPTRNIAIAEAMKSERSKLLKSTGKKWSELLKIAKDSKEDKKVTEESAAKPFYATTLDELEGSMKDYLVETRPDGKRGIKVDGLTVEKFKEIAISKGLKEKTFQKYYNPEKGVNFVTISRSGKTPVEWIFHVDKQIIIVTQD